MDKCLYFVLYHVTSTTFLVPIYFKLLLLELFSAYRLHLRGAE